MSKSTPWAILLTKWADNNHEPKPIDYLKNLFTASGTATYNMTDYFDTMSHGHLDLSGNEVFGWLTLDEKRNAYVGHGPASNGELDRNGLLAAAKAKATAAGVDLSRFWGVVVVMNIPTDLCGWIGGRAALCDPGSFQPTILGQEMGHGYGLRHSRVDGSTEDYQDPWDTMSTWDSCFYTSHPDYTLIGPGLCAANMRSMGWLDESRVWKFPTNSFEQNIILRPLHYRDLPGFLAAEAPGPTGGFLVEFRVPENWDAGIPQAAVFIHRLSDGVSYRMVNSNGGSEFLAGSEFSWGHAWTPSGLTTISVTEINEKENFAKLTIRHRSLLLNLPSIFGEIFGGVARDGGGVILVNGRPHRVDPWGPLAPALAQVVAYESADQTSDPIERLDQKKAALARIVEIASAQLQNLTEIGSPIAPTRKGENIQH